MSLDMASIILFLRLLSEGIGVSEQIAALARRIQAGGTITDTELAQARSEMDKAKADWDKAAQPKLIQNNPEETDSNYHVPENTSDEVVENGS